MKQKVNVSSLPSEDKTNLCIIGDKIIFLKKASYNLSHIENHHLYFTSNEDIRKGNWCLSFKDSLGIQTEGFMRKLNPFKSIKNMVGSEYRGKIIATTDNKLMHLSNNGRVGYPLPQIPQSFVEEYCEQGGIDNVELEMEFTEPIQRVDNEGEKWEEYPFDLKLTPNNEVIVHLIKEHLK